MFNKELNENSKVLTVATFKKKNQLTHVLQYFIKMRAFLVVKLFVV